MVPLMLTMLLVAAAPPIVGSPDPGAQRERTQGVMAPTNTFLLPPKIKDCRTDADIRAALEARRYGDQEPCDPDRMLRRTR